MANMMLPVEERNLTPAEVEALDKRRRHGHFLLVMGFQMTLVAILMTLWSGQDLTYSPGWSHPMFYWDCFVGFGALICFIFAIRLRRGTNEFFSY
jgi:hypothetical protein